MPAADDPVPATSRVGAIVQVLTRAAANRGALAGLELDDARSQVLALVLLGAAIAACTLLAGIAITLLVAAIWWDTPQRVEALAWLAGIELALGIIAALWLRRRWQSWRFLADTRETLQGDLKCLRQLVSGFTR